MDHINGELKFRKCPFCDNHFTMKNKDFKRSVKILLNISKKEKKCVKSFVDNKYSM